MDSGKMQTPNGKESGEGLKKALALHPNSRIFDFPSHPGEWLKKVPREALMEADGKAILCVSRTEMFALTARLKEMWAKIHFQEKEVAKFCELSKQKGLQLESAQKALGFAHGKNTGLFLKLLK
eukprot:Skav230027  [mRNA]  locus=scaffold261:215150:217158:- [translate_table: standard]